ncbi:MAG TPA: arginase family protein [Gemmatimonadota bacterium]|nr:arginase family protein [Gemmatimonadota bacterium]
MPVFVDHLQLLPMPFRDGVRQADGRHRPGGLGMATLSDLLNRRGWTARVEDLGFDKPMPESRLAEAFARAIGDGVESAWERRRFPIVLAHAGYAALGVIDALGERTGVVWTSARGEYRSAGVLRRPRLAERSLALATGRAKRDKLAVRPARAAGSRVIVLGGEGASDDERRAMKADGIRILGREALDRLAAEVAASDADGWYLHVDCSALAQGAVPGAGDARRDGLDPARLAEALPGVFGGRKLRTVAIVGYDMNADPSGVTTESVLALVEAAARAAGGVPRPETVGEAGG